MGKKARPRLGLLGKKLRYIRNLHSLTQPEMYRVLRPDDDPHNHSVISEYECSKRDPNLVDVFRYAEFAGISTDVLLDDNVAVANIFDKYTRQKKTILVPIKIKQIQIAHQEEPEEQSKTTETEAQTEPVKSKSK